MLTNKTVNEDLEAEPKLNRAHHDLITSDIDLYDHDSLLRQLCNYFNRELCAMKGCMINNIIINEYTYTFEVPINDKIIPVDFIFSFEKKSFTYPEGHLYLTILINNEELLKTPFSYVFLYRKIYLDKITKQLDKIKDQFGPTTIEEAKKKKKKKPYNSITYTTGDPQYNIDMFNMHFNHDGYLNGTINPGSPDGSSEASAAASGSTASGDAGGCTESLKRKYTLKEN